MTQSRYKMWERLLGGVVFLIATTTYLFTMEKSASVWDNPEFISTFSQMEVGHPPGAPFYMLFYNFLSHFYPSGGEGIAIAANSISALLSGLTIMLLFLTITHLIRRSYYLRDTWRSPTTIPLDRALVFLGGGLVGALMYAFTDTFWYSAVEAEVYSFSSFFTALVFYLILKWEEQADDLHSDRWILLIAYLMGLSVGVHLLNLLAIPAMAVIYYYRRHQKTSWQGVVKAILMSFGLIAIMMFGVLQGAPEVGGYFDLFFVNTLGMPFNTGLVFYILLLLTILGVTYYHTIRRPVQENKLRVLFLLSVILIGIPFVGSSWWMPLLIIGLVVAYLFFYAKRLPIHTLSVSTMGMFLFFIGMSTYGVILIRANSDIPMNQNNPSDAFSLRYYLSREQYGSTPLIYGQTYASLPEYEANGKARTTKTVTYRRAQKSNPTDKDRYMKVEGDQVVYRSDMKMFFPRMYSNMMPHYKDGYEFWGDVKGRSMNVNDRGESRTVVVPTFGENLKYFFNYQVNYMYWRYFLWNFSGRQNDLQGQGEIHKGNWITGIKFLDSLVLGPQENLPDIISENKGYNRYFMLPLILGLFGLVAQLYGSRRNKQSFLAILMFFFMTGLAIVLYVNQPPFQVRERDYSYAGSFYAFSIWIGFAVPALYGILSRGKKKSPALVGGITALGLGVVALVFSQNLDDHNRDGRSLASDFGNNYLESCDENAIILCNGDNDTFPLWYVQDVEGVRRDIKVCNTTYLQADWYIDQMKRNSYTENALPITWGPKEYGGEKRLVAYVLPQMKDTIPLRLGLDFIASDDPDTRRVQGIADALDYLPAQYVSFPYDVDALISNGTLYPSDTAYVGDQKMHFDFSKKYYLGRHELALLDMMEANRFERPMYYAITVGEDQRLGLTPKFRQTGMAYQIMPFETRGTGTEIDTEKMYQNVMTKFRWGGADIPGTYFDENSRRLVETYRSAVFGPLASALVAKGDTKRAKDVLDLCEKVILEENIPHSISSLPLVTAYYDMNDIAKAEEISIKIMEEKLRELNWFFSLKPQELVGALQDIQNDVLVCSELLRYNEAYKGSMSSVYGDDVKMYKDSFLTIHKMISGEI